jgi:hypothetical protein
MNKDFEKIIVGSKVKIGKKFAKENPSFKAGQIIEFIQGYFDYDNGLYVETETAPALWNEKIKEFDSIYHLFGNNGERFLDCKLINEEQVK